MLEKNRNTRISPEKSKDSDDPSSINFTADKNNISNISWSQNFPPIKSSLLNKAVRHERSVLKKKRAKNLQQCMTSRASKQK
jgi:hypothetical protein